MENECEIDEKDMEETDDALLLFLLETGWNAYAPKDPKTGEKKEFPLKEVK